MGSKNIQGQGECSKETSQLAGVGSFLKETRISKGIDSKSLAESLKIGEEQLEALERGEEEKLNEFIFIKAMIRRISERLKVDSEPLISSLEKGEPHKKRISQALLEKNNPKDRKKKSLSILGRIIAIIVLSFLSLTGLYLVDQGLESNNSERVE